MGIREDIIKYYNNLEIPGLSIPNLEILFPFKDEEVKKVIDIFYRKFFSSGNSRRMLIGINPGRFGGGTTGIPFTDPINLENVCGIENNFQKRFELSSRFIYDMIEQFGGPGAFYDQYYFYSVSPVGFTRGGKNFNYYDDKKLKEELEPYIVEHMNMQLEMGMDRELAFSLGQGRNLKELLELNQKYNFFKKIIPLPHPRWVMQYRLKKKDFFIKEYLKSFSEN